MLTEVKQIIKTLNKHGYTAYLAGGCVRDFLLGLHPTDYDIATDALPHNIEQIFPHTISVGKNFGVIIVIINKKPYEIATFRSDHEYTDGRRPVKINYSNAQEDAKRRDFTINGLFADISKSNKITKKNIIDYVNGIHDLNKKIIRFIGNPNKRIKEDYLRILRAIRFKNKLDFRYDNKTLKAIIRNKNLVTKISKERIKEELTKMLHLKNNYKAFKEMYDLGILQLIIPEFENLHTIKQEPKYHSEGDVWTHTLMCLKDAYNENDEILWALLLHDIGKKYTTFVDKDGRIRSNNHDIEGAKIAKKILKELHFSNKSIKKIVWLIEQHLRIHFIFDMKLHKQKTFCYHEYFPDLLKVQYYDEKGRKPSNLQRNINTVKLYKKLMKEKEKDIKPILNGHEIIEIFNIKQGKKVGEILNTLKEAQLNRKIQTKEEAKKWLIKKYKIKN